MSLRQLTTGTDVSWDGGLVHIPAGTIIDCPPGSAMEAAYGPGNLVDLDADAAAAAASCWRVELTAGLSAAGYSGAGRNRRCGLGPGLTVAARGEGSGRRGIPR